MRLTTLALLASLSTPAAAQSTLCDNFAMAYPSPHALLEAPGLTIECGDDRTIAPVHMAFDRIEDLEWYATHEGTRDVVSDDDE